MEVKKERLLFFLINMNLGGTERSFLNLLSKLPDHYVIDLLLLEEYGELLKDVPANVQIHILKNNTEINEFLKLGNRGFAGKELQRGRFLSFIKNMIIWVLLKMKLIKHPFYGVSHYLQEFDESYDNAIAYAGIHNFIAYYTLNYIQAEKRFLWIHFDVTKIGFDTQFANYFYDKFQKIICVSQVVKTNLNRSLTIDITSKLEVVHNILDLEEIEIKSKQKDIHWNPDIVQILTVGRLSAEKGHADFLPVILKLKQKKLKFKWWIIGDGKERSKIDRLIQELNLSDNVEVLGKKENPFPYYKACDVYLQPSKYEGHCVSIIEAKYFNKPIVSNNFAGITDEIENEYNGLICEMNFDSQYKALEKVIKNKGLRLQFSINLSKETKQEFDNPFS